MKKLICAAMALALLAACAGALAEGAAAGSFTFATTDLDGNIVTSAELYAGNKITVFNFWATWCPPCVGELGALAQLHRQLREMDCGVVGILLDDDFDAARRLMKENSTDYPVLLLSEDMYDLVRGITTIPTTCFADEAGRIVGEPIVGAYPDRYLSAVEALVKKF